MPPTSEHPRSVHNADGGIVLDISNGRMFSLNSSGSVIFQLLEQGFSDQQIVEEMVRRFGITADVARSDFSDFCRSLESQSLLLNRSASLSE